MNIHASLCPHAFVLALVLAASGAAAHAPDFKELLPPAKEKSPPVAPELAELTKRYRLALEKKDLAAFKALHDDGVLIFESGHKNVGWADYEKNHLAPELAAFKTFSFTTWDEASRMYESTGLIVADVAYAIETVDGKSITAKGVATLVVRRGKTGWKIIHTHWSTQRRT